VVVTPGALKTDCIGASTRCAAKPCGLKHFPRRVSRERDGASIATRLSGSDIPHARETGA